MPFRILVADDDEAVRKSHRFALDAAADLLKDGCEVVESDDSVDAWAKIKSERFNLIIVDNDFRDKDIKGHLPGIALLQRARKEGVNTATPIIFCSGETFETLKPMVEKFNAVHFPKGGYDIDRAARLFAEQLNPGQRKDQQ
ncbi:MAG TPA: response regulator [Bacteroidota bacterium]|nr:response regulator [Bacteroidota bacterium]